jgi:hypothetical protein
MHAGMFHVRYVTCHHGMPSPGCGRVDGLQIWKAAARILNKQSRPADKGKSSSLVVGTAATTLHLEK